MTEDVRAAAQRAGTNPVIEKGARLGFFVSGLLHLLIGWIALRVAWGGGSEDADQSGALAMLADTPAGPALLWVAVAGFALLSLWFLVESVAARRFNEMHERIGTFAKAIVYAVLAFSAVRVIQRGSQSGEETTESLTADLLANPAGQILVGAVGLGILGVGGFHIYRGWTQTFEKDLESDPGDFVMMSGRVGYVAKGVAFLVIAFLFLSAAMSDRASEAGGLDGALRTVRDQAFGPYLLTLAAVGIAAFGVYCFGRARHAKF